MSELVEGEGLGPEGARSDHEVVGGFGGEAVVEVRVDFEEVGDGLDVVEMKFETIAANLR